MTRHHHCTLHHGKPSILHNTASTTDPTKQIKVHHHIPKNEAKYSDEPKNKTTPVARKIG